jgi:hypothetical protein
MDANHKLIGTSSSYIAGDDIDSNTTAPFTILIGNGELNSLLGVNDIKYLSLSVESTDLANYEELKAKSSNSLDDLGKFLAASNEKIARDKAYLEALEQVTPTHNVTLENGTLLYLAK